MSKNKPKTLQGLESLGALFGTDLPTGTEQEEQVNEEESLIEASKFDLRVSLDKKQRKGKAVTLVTGFGDLHEDDIDKVSMVLDLNQCKNLAMSGDILQDIEVVGCFEGEELRSFNHGGLKNRETRKELCEQHGPDEGTIFAEMFRFDVLLNKFGKSQRD